MPGTVLGISAYTQGQQFYMSDYLSSLDCCLELWTYESNWPRDIILRLMYSKQDSWPFLQSRLCKAFLNSANGIIIHAVAQSRAWKLRRYHFFPPFLAMLHGTRILVPWPGIKPMTPALEARSLHQCIPPGKSKKPALNAFFPWPLTFNLVSGWLDLKHILNLFMFLLPLSPHQSISRGKSAWT